MNRQGGMAVIMALLLVALAASATSLVLWQQNLWWQQLASDRRRAEMHALADAGLALGVARLRPSAVVGANQSWARPGLLREGEGRVAVRIEDAQGRLNLNGLAGGGSLVDEGWLTVLRRLLSILQLPTELADNLVRWRGLQTQSEQDAGRRLPGGHPSLTRWEDLARVPGFSPERMARLAPHVIVLPEGVRRVNVNTASASLLAALLPEAAPGMLAAAIAGRGEQPFRDVTGFLARIGVSSPARIADLGTGSDYFLLQASVRHGAASRQTVAMLKVELDRTRLLWRRDRPGIAPSEEGKT
jgi:general secretion pathway protein K